ncbi:TMV resistance protein N-like, partial [Neltuma alba]|uniref:TMV resistance protein N-like n=1 Tax=Neltuma alba TaxID=207710 RepID=UPI0010A35E61
MASSPSSSSSWTYDVFLSFRGQDTRRGFASHLYNALKQRRIHAFVDNPGTGLGGNILETLFQAIEESRIALVILSPDYAFSAFCLDELVKIMECKRSQAQMVIPIFYQVDPSHVRHQKGTYGEAIQRHEQRLGKGSDRVLRWSEALTAAANLAGFSFSDSEYSWYESELVEKIVEKVSRELGVGESPFVTERPMRMESEVDKWFHYDVFLSFNGEDTRRSFTSHLYNALKQRGIHAFMDEPGIERGEDVSGSLVQAIGRSQIALVILSPHYASSKWCLNELVKIMEFQRSQAQVVIPIFYEVDPSHVRHQRGTYGEAIERHEERLGRDNDGVMRWRMALAAAANISGFSSSAYRLDSELIETIVENVSEKVDTGQLSVAKHPVGIESRVHALTIEWSEKRSSKPLIIGLWGMGGIGKTTVAKAIYNTIGRKFGKARSFLANIRENSEHANGQVNLQKQLIYDIIKTEVFKIPNIDRGKKIIQERFPNIKAFVVLDDVDSVNQLNAFCGSLDWFCAGSVIFITTRDLHLLDVINADHKYRMREMNGMELLVLFSWHAFNQADPYENFVELSEKVVAYCDGLPLALEILGSCLRGRTIEQWKDVLSKLQRIP